MKVRKINGYLDVTLGLLCLGGQEVALPVHGDPGVATLGPPDLLGAGAAPELPEELPGGGEDDDPGVRHDDLTLGPYAHRGQLLELSRLLAPDPDFFLSLPQDSNTRMLPTPLSAMSTSSLLLTATAIGSIKSSC